MTLNSILSTGGRNHDLVVRINTTNLSSSFVECTFIQPVYTCTIDYGTDPSYTNLDYRDTSYTQGQVTTIILSQELRGDTTYYYIVSAENSSQCMKVQGKFPAGMYKSFGVYQWEIGINGTGFITSIHGITCSHRPLKVSSLTSARPYYTLHEISYK